MHCNRKGNPQAEGHRYEEAASGVFLKEHLLIKNLSQHYFSENLKENHDHNKQQDPKEDHEHGHQEKEEAVLVGYVHSVVLQDCETLDLFVLGVSLRIVLRDQPLFLFAVGRDLRGRTLNLADFVFDGETGDLVERRD